MKIYVVNWSEVLYDDGNGNNFFDDRLKSGNLEKVFTDLKKAQAAAQAALGEFADNVISELEINEPEKHRYDHTFPNGLNEYCVCVSGKIEYGEEWDYAWDYADITITVEEHELED